MRTRANTAFVTVDVVLSSVAGEELCVATSTLLHTWPIGHEEEA